MAPNLALITANTGVAKIDTADPSLTGAGAVTVLKAGDNGTIIKSIVIKATAPVTNGMVRLFIKKSNPTITVLCKEIVVSTTPSLPSTPFPMPTLQTFEIVLSSDMKLQSGFELMASTQNPETFNVIAEGLDWAYSNPLPTMCCVATIETANTGIGIVKTANNLLNGLGTIEQILTAGNANGSIIKSIVVKALQSTSFGMLRFFISIDNGATFFLIKELNIPQSNQSAFEASYHQILDSDYYIQAGAIIGVSTELSQAFAITIESVDWAS